LQIIGSYSACFFLPGSFAHTEYAKVSFFFLRNTNNGRKEKLTLQNLEYLGRDDM